MNASRRVSGVFGSLFAFVFIFAAVAWACTPQTVITQLRPLSGPAGTPLTITGSTIDPVEIRWNSPEGQVLANASGKNFSTTVQVPSDAQPGVYYLMSNGRALETFQVTPAGEAPQIQKAQGDLWSGFDSRSDGSLATEPGAGASNSAPRTAGMALLGLGLLASFSTVATLVLRRFSSKVSAGR